MLKVKVKGLQSACAIAPFQVISAKKARSDVASLKGDAFLEALEVWIKDLKFLPRLPYLKCPSAFALSLPFHVKLPI